MKKLFIKDLELRFSFSPIAITTQALGEEGNQLTTEALGEEGNKLTTQALGEEGKLPRQ